MAINNDETVTVPAVTAVPEKTYPHLWLTDIHVQAKTNTQGSLGIEAVPYNGDTGEVAETAAVDDCVEMETLADNAVEDNHHVGTEIVKKAHSDEHPLHRWWDGYALCTPVQDTQLGPCSSYDWSW